LPVIARTVFFHHIEAVKAKHERDSLREAKTALDQKLLHLLLPQFLRFLVAYASLELIKVIASPDGMRAKSRPQD
jgi:hypothetical protein